MFEEARAACTYLVSKYAISPTQKDLYPLQDVTTKAKIDQKLYFDAGTFYATLRADYVSFRFPEFPPVRDFQIFWLPWTKIRPKCLISFLSPQVLDLEKKSRNVTKGEKFRESLFTF